MRERLLTLISTSPEHGPAGQKMRFLLTLLVALAVASGYAEDNEEAEECSRFCPHELRATVFDPLMLKKIKFLRAALEAAIDGLEELEQKTMDVPESMKEKLGLNDVDEDKKATAGEMRSFLLDHLDFIIRQVARVWSDQILTCCPPVVT